MRSRGGFTFDHVPEGRYFVVASADGLAPTVVPAAAGDAAIELALERGIEVTLSLQREGQPFEGEYDYRVRDAAGVIVAGHDLRDTCGGARRGMRLRKGDYTVEVFARFHHPDPVGFTAAADAEAIVDMAALPGRSSDR